MPELIAYHEAGHALIAALLGGRVHLVTIEPDNDDGPSRSGETVVHWRRGFGAREMAVKGVQVYLAGPVAEMTYSGDHYHPGLIAEWADDWQHAWKTAELLHSNEKKRLDYLEQVSMDLYQQFQRDEIWAALASLADNLLAHDTLEWEQVEEIVQDWIR